MSTTTELDQPLIRLSGITKSFGAARALDGVSFEIGRGRVHALVGENGAGKSTLGKILGGALPPDHGDLVVGGEPVRYGRPHDALNDGIAIMQQEIALAPDLTVAQNVMLGREPRRWGLVKRRELLRSFAELRDRTGFELNGDDLVTNLPLSKQQQVEILRAVARNARLIVMDEPTAALEASDARRLHQVVRGLRDSGVSVVYVSHFLQEVLELADDVTIMRNGRHVSTQPAGDLSVETLIFGMLGRNLEGMFPEIPRPSPAPAPLLDVRGLQVPGRVHGVSLTVDPGEVVGLYGLVGSGRSEVALSLFGAMPGASFTASLDGTAYAPTSPRQALAHGVCVLPESRKDQGLFLGMDQLRNTSMNVVQSFVRWGLLSHRAEGTAVTEALAGVEVDRIELASDVATLSGGNQQKVLLAKCLMVAPRVLILDEPTRGVDVGARRSIYEKVSHLVASGMGLIVISSDIEEVTRLSHRVYVMHDGRITGEFVSSEDNHDAILNAAFGITPPDMRGTQP
jgi:simple sugar transport system ATP-binding protein/ribose transport system ATP-binding protein